MLHHAVIVASNCARTDVRARTHMGVTDVGQVINLRALINYRILDFNEVANAGEFSKFCSRAQACVRANGAPRLT